MQIFVTMLEAKQLLAIWTEIVIDGEQLALASPTEIFFLLHLQQLPSIHMFHAAMRFFGPVVLVAKLYHRTPTSLLHFLQW
jgi:hypothetical protein